MAAFAGRGLLNSSMAIEAANEAMIAKAIEIAGPDAETYFKQSNLNQQYTNQFANNWQQQQYNLQNLGVQNQYTQSNMGLQNQYDQSNMGLQDKFAKENMGLQNQYTQSNMGLQNQYAKELATLQQSFSQSNVSQAQANNLQTNYLTTVSRIEEQFTAEMSRIQSLEMSPEDKTIAIEQAQLARDSSIRLTTLAYTQMPGWSPQWSRLPQALPSTSEGALALPANLDLSSDYTKWNDDDLADVLDFFDMPSNRNKVTDDVRQKWIREGQSRLAKRPTF
jgi:hypothetical protein